SYRADDAVDMATVVQEVLAEAFLGADVHESRSECRGVRRESGFGRLLLTISLLCTHFSLAHQRQRKTGRGDQAGRIATAAAGQVKRGAMIDRGADERQAEGEVDGAIERLAFQHG